MSTDLVGEQAASTGRHVAPPGFEGFFRSSYRPLTRSLLPVSEYAAQAVQDAFVQALRQWDVVRNYESPSAWVRRTAVNNIREHCHQQTQASAMAPLGGLRADGSPLIQILPDLEAALSQLPVRQRLAMTLFYIADLSVHDISVAGEQRDRSRPCAGGVDTWRSRRHPLAGLALFVNASAVVTFLLVSPAPGHDLPQDRDHGRAPALVAPSNRSTPRQASPVSQCTPPCERTKRP
ncbi:MAG: RNA polymerase sigma factor [Acidimicrobiales bacterium]